MDQGLILVLVGIIGLIVGFAIGLAVGVLRSAPSAPAQTATQVSPPEGKVVEVKTALPESEKADTQVETPNVEEMPVQGSEIKRPSMNPINVLARAIQSDVGAPRPADRSIAVQVDEILQEMLKNSPLASRAIRLMELPQKGMVVMIGLDQFDGVDAVPDEDIRQVLRAAVAEWERRVSSQEK